MLGKNTYENVRYETIDELLWSVGKWKTFIAGVDVKNGIESE
jgi:hypothetical protein